MRCNINWNMQLTAPRAPPLVLQAHMKLLENCPNKQPLKTINGEATCIRTDTPETNLLEAYCA